MAYQAFKFKDRKQNIQSGDKISFKERIIDFKQSCSWFSACKNIFFLKTLFIISNWNSWKMYILKIIKRFLSDCCFNSTIFVCFMQTAIVLMKVWRKANIFEYRIILNLFTNHIKAFVKKLLSSTLKVFIKAHFS